MCATCGCSDDHAHAHPHTEEDAARRTVAIEVDVLAKNDALGRGQPGLARGSGHGGGQPHELAGLGQDDAPRAHDPRRRRRAHDLGHRRRPGDPARCGSHRGRRGPGDPDHDRVGLPSRRHHGGGRAPHPRPAARLRRLHRERRQPRVPGAVRSGRNGPGRDHVGHRGRRQAAQVPAHVPRRPTWWSSTRSTCSPTSTSTSSAASPPSLVFAPVSRPFGSRPRPAQESTAGTSGCGLCDGRWPSPAPSDSH